MASMIFETVMRRPENFDSLEPDLQWAVDKRLGLLDWDGHCAHRSNYLDCPDCKARYEARFMNAKPNQPQRSTDIEEMQLAALDLGFSDAELKAVAELAHRVDLTVPQLVRQALRTYVGIHQGSHTLTPVDPPIGCPSLDDGIDLISVGVVSQNA